MEMLTLQCILILALLSVWCVGSTVPTKKIMVVALRHAPWRIKHGPPPFIFDISSPSLLGKLAGLKEIHVDKFPVNGSTINVGRPMDALQVQVEMSDAEINLAAAKLDPMEVRISYAGQIGLLLTADMIVENVSYTGKYRANGTFLKDVVTIEADGGSFDIKLHLKCVVSIPLTASKKGSYTLTEKGGSGYCWTHATAASTFTDILKDAKPELSAEDKGALSKFLSIQIGSNVVGTIMDYRDFKGASKHIMPALVKAVRDALKLQELSFKDIVGNYKPMLSDLLRYYKRNDG